MDGFIPTDNLFLWNTCWLLLLFGFLSTLIIILYIKNVNRQKEILALKNKLVSVRFELDELVREREKKQAFRETLSSAEVTTRLQTPRLNLKIQTDSKPPEKYRYVATMARNGMQSKDISEILGISETEADQLIKLARLSE